MRTRISTCGRGRAPGSRSPGPPPAPGRRAAPPAGGGGGGGGPPPFASWPEPPTADALEASAPGRPAVLWSRDRHAGLASRAALVGAGVTARTPDPAGGALGRDAAGV